MKQGRSRFHRGYSSGGGRCDVPVGRSVIVIGGGMTAVDAAVQARKLGAREVSIVYRRGAEAMSASAYEQEAQKNGVTIRHWAAPKEILRRMVCSPACALLRQN